jgi:hypothetical protein
MIKSRNMVLGRVMSIDPRYISSALAGIFAVVVIFAAVTIVRELTHPTAALIARPS